MVMRTTARRERGWAARKAAASEVHSTPLKKMTRRSAPKSAPTASRKPSFCFNNPLSVSYLLAELALYYNAARTVKPGLEASLCMEFSERALGASRYAVDEMGRPARAV